MMGNGSGGTGKGSGLIPAALASVRSLAASDYVRKIAETFATRMFLILIGLIVGVIVARILGPEQRGVYAVALTTGAIVVQFGNLGLHTSNTYYSAKSKDLLPALLGNSLAVSAFFGVAGIAAALVLESVWPDLLPAHGLLLLMMLLWIPLNLGYILLQNLVLGLYDIRFYNIIEILATFLKLLLLGGIVVGGLIAVESVFSVEVAVMILSCALALWRLGAFSRYIRLSLDVFKETLRYGFKSYLSCLFAYLVLKVNLLLVGYMIGDLQAGYYSIATSLADMIFMLPSIAGTILFPRLAAMADERAKWTTARKAAAGVGVIVLAMVIVAWPLAPALIGLVFGPEYLPATPAFVWLLPAIVLLSINTILQNYFSAIGMPHVIWYSPAIALVFSVLLNLYMIPNYGIVGASVSSILSYGLMLAISIIFIAGHTKKWKENGAAPAP